MANMSATNLEQAVKTTRSELKNLREEIHKLKKGYKKEIDNAISSLQILNLAGNQSENAAFNIHTSNLAKNHSDNAIEIPQMSDLTENPSEVEDNIDFSSEMFTMTPIGHIESCFKSKNGIPRQASICPSTKALLTIDKSVFTNPEHSLQGMEEFSHLWVLFMFHKNTVVKNPKAKVHPPRLHGLSTGVFASRSPHRPNPLGLSLCKIEKIDGAIIELSGVDLLDGTPVLDIKPYIPLYDVPGCNMSREAFDTVHQFNICSPDTNSEEARNVYDIVDSKTSAQILQETESTDHVSSASNVMVENIPDILLTASNIATRSESKLEANLLENSPTDVKIASWISDPGVSLLRVLFTSRAEEDIWNFHHKETHEGLCDFCLQTFQKPEEVKHIIKVLLENDTRSVYRRTKCKDRLYYFSIDAIHVTCWFDDKVLAVEVLKVQPLGHLHLT